MPKTGTWLAALLLAACSVVLAWPVLAGGGAVTYLDNPVHLAEAHALAHTAGRGWSEVAYCGFPVHQLHSPLWYGALAALARAGLPLEPLYAGAVWLGFLAPSLALFVVARRRLGVLPAALVAYLLLIQRPGLLGLGSALSGMWTFSLAAAGLILLLDRLVRPHHTPRDLAWTAALFGFIGLTHLFVVLPAVLCLALLALLRRGRAMGRLVLAGGVGAAASMVYWLPLLLATGGRLEAEVQHLSPGLLFARLLLPTRYFGLAAGNLDSHSVPGDLYYTDAVPMVALAALGLAGLWRVCRDHRRGVPGGDLSAMGGLASLVVLAVLIWAEPMRWSLLGPVSWRFLAIVRIGLALAALAWLSRPGKARLPPPPTPVLAALAVAALATCFWWARPLVREVPPASGPEMREVRALWQELAARRSPQWGRVYIQDTLLTAPFDRKLGMSHVLALTARETGVRQLGAAYSVTPFNTASWTASEMGNLYSQPPRGGQQLQRLLWMMERSNATHLVLSDPFLARHMDGVGVFQRQRRIGRYTIYARRDAISHWTAPRTAGLEVDSEDHRPGRIAVTVDNRARAGRLLVKTAAAPAWRLRGPPGARLVPTRDGLMQVVGLAPGRHAMVLTYRPDRWPTWVSICAWVLLAGVLAWVSRPSGPTGAGRRPDAA